MSDSGIHSDFVGTRSKDLVHRTKGTSGAGRWRCAIARVGGVIRFNVVMMIRSGVGNGYSVAMSAVTQTAASLAVRSIFSRGYVSFQSASLSTGAVEEVVDVPVWATELCEGHDGVVAAPVVLPTLEHDVTAHVCVIGLGGSGLSCIAELMGQGQAASVVGIDAHTVASGAAGKNGGFLLAGVAKFHHHVVAALGERHAQRLYELTLNEMDHMESETPDCITRCGTLRIAASEDEELDCAQQFALMRRQALPVEPYAGPEGRGLLFPRDGAFQPLRRCTTLARRAVARGVRLYADSRAVQVERGRVWVRNRHGHVHSVHCARVIVAVDGGLVQLLPELAPRLHSVRLQMLATAPLPQRVAPRPVYARWGHDYWQQLPSGRLALGGFRDCGGAAEFTDDARAGGAVQGRLEHFLRHGLGLQAPVTHRWAAVVTYDRRDDAVLPLLAEVRPGVWVCGAYNGTGNVIGSLCGRALAQLVSGDGRLFRDIIHGPA